MRENVEHRRNSELQQTWRTETASQQNVDSDEVETAEVNMWIVWPQYFLPFQEQFTVHLCSLWKLSRVLKCSLWRLSWVGQAGHGGARWEIVVPFLGSKRWWSWRVIRSVLDTFSGGASQFCWKIGHWVWKEQESNSEFLVWASGRKAALGEAGVVRSAGQLSQVSLHCKCWQDMSEHFT